VAVFMLVLGAVCIGARVVASTLAPVEASTVAPVEVCTLVPAEAYIQGLGVVCTSGVVVNRIGATFHHGQYL
jgi:hypothetical protein